VVEYKDVDSLVWQRAAVVDGYTRSVAVHGLRDAALGDYVFRVSAVNEMGAGEPLDSDVTVRPARPTAGRSNLFIELLAGIVYCYGDVSVYHVDVLCPNN